MKVRDIQTVLLDELVIIYIDNGESYCDLYKGSSSDIPERLLDYDIHFVFPASKKRKGSFLNICVW